MEKLAAKINLIVVALLVLSAAAIFFISAVRGDLIIGIIGGALTWIGIQILKITINESA